MSKPRSKPGILGAVLLVALLLLGYMGVYYAIVEPHPAPAATLNEVTYVYVGHSYRFGGEFSRCLFAPAHYLDKHVFRRDKWVL